MGFRKRRRRPVKIEEVLQAEIVRVEGVHEAWIYLTGATHQEEINLRHARGLITVSAVYTVKGRVKRYVVEVEDD